MLKMWTLGYIFHISGQTSKRRQGSVNDVLKLSFFQRAIILILTGGEYFYSLYLRWIYIGFGTGFFAIKS